MVVKSIRSKSYRWDTFFHWLDFTLNLCVFFFKDGESYVCASTDQFKKLEYNKCVGTTAMRRSRITYGQGAICREASMISGLDHWKERRSKNHVNNNSNGLSSSGYGAAVANGGDSSPRWAEYMKPRLITIIRNGSRPRKAVRLLLNKKTAFTYEQVDSTFCIITETHLFKSKLLQYPHSYMFIFFSEGIERYNGGNPTRFRNRSETVHSRWETGTISLKNVLLL